MQDAMTVTVVLAGLFFSFACALLLEELLFGGIFRLFFARRAAVRTHAMPQFFARRNRPRPDGGEELRNDNYYL